MEKPGVAALLVTLVLAGCASSTQPSVMVYPAKGQSAEQQTRDSGECQTWAKAQTAKYPEGRQSSAVIPLLWRAQEQAGGWVPEAAIRHVADLLGMANIRVLEIATFYTMFNQYSKSKEGYDRAYAACMQGRGYAVK